MRYLGIDFGLKRIGLAISEGNIASPYKIVEVKNLPDAFIKMIQIIEAEGMDQVVVGMPEGKMGQTVKGFINKLINAGVKVEEADETLSTHEAIQQMIKTNIPKEKRKMSDDMAATIILQNWLDNQ